MAASPASSPPTRARRVSGCARQTTGRSAHRRRALDDRRRVSGDGRGDVSIAGVTAPTDAVDTSTARGMMSIPNQIVEPIGDGWALVGDAGYHRDAITGHGISDAFRDAELLAERVGPCAVHSPRRARSPARLPRRCEIGCSARSSRSPAQLCERSAASPAFVELQKQLGIAIDRRGRRARRPTRIRRRTATASSPPARAAGYASGDNHQPAHPRSTTPKGTLTMTSMTSTSRPATASTPRPCSPRSTPSRHAPAAAQFQFRADNEWIDGTHSRCDDSPTSSASARSGPTSATFALRRGPSRPSSSARTTVPTPVEFVLHALAVVPDRRPGQHRRRPQGIHPHRGPLHGHR